MVNDNENAELAEHPVNKCIKMMCILSALMYKINLKEQLPVQVELITRCAKYFGFPVPKQYRQDLNAMLKQKDFLSLAKERMVASLNAQLNRANGVTEEAMALNQAGGQYKYFIGGGNNHMLVKTVFK
jgi:Mg2+/Co2+ transporter CorC